MPDVLVVPKADGSSIVIRDSGLTIVKTADGYLALPSSVAGVAPPPDTTAPTLSSPVGTQTGTTTATVGATTNEGNGTLYYVVTLTPTPPTAVQVEAGQNAAGSAAVKNGSQAISSTGAKTFSVTGLASSTTYYAHLMHKDAAGNRSTVVSSSSFTTSASSTTQSFAYSVGAPGWAFSTNILTDATKLFTQSINGTSNQATIWAGIITGTDAWITAGCAIGGYGAGMIEVSVDGGAWTAPTPISGTVVGELPLFTGAGQAAHLVVVRTGAGYGTNNVYQPTSGNVWRVTGVSPALQPFTNWAQPGDGNSNTITSNVVVANVTNYVPSNVPTNDNTYKVNVSALAVRGDFTELVAAIQAGRYLHVSVDGAAPTRYDLGASPKMLQRITGLSGTHTYYVWGSTQGGQMAVGGLAATGISNIATKKRLDQFGDSITEGIGATSQGDTDTFRTAAARGYIGENLGIAGDTTATLKARIDTILAAKTISSSDVAVIAIGRNDVGAWTGTTTTNYQYIVNACLTKGYGKVVCRGLLPDGDGTAHTTENTIINGIVSGFADARVLYCNPNSLGPYGTIDNEHPNDAGYVTIDAFMQTAYAGLGV